MGYTKHDAGLVGVPSLVLVKLPENVVECNLDLAVLLNARDLAPTSQLTHLVGTHHHLRQWVRQDSSGVRH